MGLEKKFQKQKYLSTPDRSVQQVNVSFQKGCPLLLKEVGL